MTKTQILLEEVREKLDGATDYRIAKALELPRQTVSHYQKGRRNADAYAATRIAILLGRDPLQVMAEIEGEAATTQEKRDFWRSFRSGLTPTLLGGALLLTGSFSAPGQAGADSSPVRIMWDYGKRRLRGERRKAPSMRGFFVDANVCGHHDRRRPGRPA